MKLKLDENLGERGRATLLAAGHDVDTVGDEGLCGATDAAVADAACADGRALVTLDTDFAQPLRFPPQTTPGIIVLRLTATASETALERALVTMVAALARDDVAGQLWIVEPERVRIYAPRLDDEV